MTGVREKFSDVIRREHVKRLQPSRGTVVLAVVLIVGTSCTRPVQRGVSADGAPNAPGSEAGIPLKEWTVGHVPLRLSLGKGPVAYLIEAAAPTQEQADTLVEPILKQGPGSVVSAGVTIRLFLEVDATGGFLCVHSSMVGEFDVFEVTVGEQVLADLQAAENVEVNHPGNGWTTVTTRLPPGRVPAGTMASLRQHRKGGPADDVVSFAMQF